MTDTFNEPGNSEATPDSLMSHFQGRGLMPIAVFTLVVHLVVIVGSSIPKLLRGNTSELDKDARIKLAVQDATSAIRDIAEEYELNPQDISRQFTGARPAPKPTANGDAARTGDNKPEDGEKEPERVKSAYETNLETKADGPKMPTFDDKKDDIF